MDIFIKISLIFQHNLVQMVNAPFHIAKQEDNSSG